MTKVLVLGGSGMLGHKLCQVASSRFEVHASFRRLPHPAYSQLLPARNHHAAVDAAHPETIAALLDALHPDVVVNCIGVIKQLAAGSDPVSCITINALFPHLLARLCEERGIRLVCISTDCVFSGRQGNYVEDDTSDAADLYGRTKFLGEVATPGCLTLRTSIIGRELTGTHGLLEWFLSQNGRSVRGFKRAIFSGLPTRHLAGMIGKLIEHFPDLAGLYHVAADPINKLDLLTLIRDRMELAIDIEPDESFVCDRSLNGERFRKTTGIAAPSWPALIDEMCGDPTPYEGLRAAMGAGL